jgi:hypothetical protein
MTRTALILLVSLISNISIGQDLIAKNLKKFQWTTDSTINNMTVGNFKEIGLSKLKVATDSIKKNCSVWTFTENKIIIQKYSSKNGVESNNNDSSYEYKNGELFIYHFAQDSTVWKYNVGIISTESFILLTRKKK